MRSYIEIGEYDRLDKYVAGFQGKVQPPALIDNGMPFINVHIGQQGKMISIVILNTAEQPINAVGDTLLTTKEDKEAHGYGVKSMSQMAAQMHGMLTWSCEHQVFRLSVLLQDTAV